MIWALLEITLPLCLAFLFGLGAGWLFWRWRRRSISQTDWDKQGSRKQGGEALAAVTQTLGLSNPETGDLESLQGKLAQANTEKAEVERKLKDAASRGETQSKLASELQQKLKQSESVATERDSAIAKNKELEEKLSEWNRKESELKSKHNEAAREKRTLQEQILKLQSELDQTSTQASDSAAYKQRLEALESQLIQASDTAEDEMRSLQTQIQTLQAELHDARAQASDSATDKQKLKALETQLSQTSDAAAENEQSLQGQIKNLQTELSQVRTQASQNAAADEQKLKDLEAQLARARDTAEHEKRGLQEKIRRLQSELDQARAQASDSAADKEKLRALESQLQQTTDAAEKDQYRLQENIEKLKTLLEQARSQASDNAADKQKLRILESQLTQANNAASELNQAKVDIASLNTQLNKSRLELAQRTQNNAAESQHDELRDARTRLANMTVALNKARARNSQLEANKVTTVKTSAAPVTPIDVGRIKKLEKEVAEKDQQIADLLKKAGTAKRKPKPAKAKSKKNDWQQGKTKLGTPGANHKDDLTVINGIGPKIQKVLNRQGIKSIEQIAAFKAADVKLVDEALVEFSGRIQRDEWVPQAKAIMRNGHQPPAAKAKRAKTVAKKPQKAKKAKSRKPAWQTGKTKFGTPGSAHRDDLKVVNGIGPVIEKALNRSGIRSWEQLAALKAADVKVIDEALDFPGRIQREQWVQQAKALVRQFPDTKDRPTRRTYLNQAAS